jgi:hypothetical protein
MDHYTLADKDGGALARAAAPLGTNISTAWVYGITGVWGICLTNLHAVVDGVESGWRWLPSHKLGRRCGAPPVILRLD